MLYIKLIKDREMEDTYLSRAETAELLGTSVNYLAQARMRKVLPCEYDPTNGRVRYLKSRVDEYLQEKINKIKAKYKKVL